jgi:hypothetical protein
MPERPGFRSVEQRDVSGRGLAVFAIGFVAFLAVALVLLYLVYGTAPPVQAIGTGIAGDAPRLEVDPRGDLAIFRATKARELAVLGWVDRDAGIARIPIDDALAIVLRSGLPRWERPAPPADADCAALAQVPRAPQCGEVRR